MDVSDAPEALTASLRDVIRGDIFGAILAIMLAFVVVAPLAMAGYAAATGWQPEESWLEVFFGVLVLVLAGSVLLRWRAARVNALLGGGRVLRARLVRFTPAGQWVVLRLSYQWDGKMYERSFVVPFGKRSQQLGEQSELTLAVHPRDPRSGVIVDLYRPV